MGAGRIGEIAAAPDRRRAAPPTRRSPRSATAPAPTSAPCARRSPPSPTPGCSRRARSSSARSPRSTSRGSSRRPLFGRSVVVTRAREQASELRVRLEALGRRGGRAARDRDRAARVRACPTSARTSGSCSPRSTASHAFFDRGLAPAGLDARALGGVRVAAIGPGTARALARTRRPRRPRARALRRRVAARRVPRPGRRGARVLLARAEQARDVLPEGLGERGYAVDVLPVYRTVPAVPDADGARSACARATSTRSRSRRRRPSTTSAPRSAPLPDPQPLVVSIGPVTSATAVGRGLRVDAEADRAHHRRPRRHPPR